MKQYDDAQDDNNKYLVNLNDYLFKPIFYTHISTSNYLLPTVFSESQLENKYQVDNIFISNEQIWQEIISERLRRTDINIILEQFYVFDWFPRSPGLYHTGRAKYAREDAYQRMISIEKDLIVFDPYGKQSMIEGGIGNIRLKPIKLEDDEYVFLTASSNGVCHEGFPIAMPIEMYNIYIDKISKNGAVALTLVGKLKFIPEKYVSMYSSYTNVPQLYLLINDIINSTSTNRAIPSKLTISIAVSFTSNYEGRKKIYATYVNFNPGDKESFRDGVSWMEEEYVLKKYNGIIITDFDERVSHFRDAVFSLSKVMSLKINESDYAFVSDYIHSENFLNHQNQIKIEIGEIYMGSKYDITGGQQGAVGDGAQASNFQMIWNGISSSIDLNILADELKKIRERAVVEENTSANDISLSNIAVAETAAKEGNGTKALEYLSKAGKWALDIATKIGASVAESAIKSSLGLP